MVRGQKNNREDEGQTVIVSTHSCTHPTDSSQDSFVYSAGQQHHVQLISFKVKSSSSFQISGYKELEKVELERANHSCKPFTVKEFRGTAKRSDIGLGETGEMRC
ncbi:hypothetical protein C5167_002055 [Papaver somniferum]|uniref:Uncharacterized protein n=1 Tax=Papaver somniferum TaxID=3469 RepID=A0A4Y7KWY5_PAPSO|nr:hypothetical protein C5167_002055 [Papaver somniferum]